MLVLHHLENSRSQRILWLLEELNVDYEICRYERDSDTGLAPKELLEVHPLGKSPVIVDGEVTAAESGAIIEYLVEHYDTDGRLKPAAGSEAARAYTYWLHYAEGSFMPLMILSLVLNRIESAPMPFFVKPVARGIAQKVRDNFLDRNVERHLAFMNDALDERDWFVGDALSAADIQMSFALEAAEVRADFGARHGNLAAFLKRIRDRPAYRAALKKGGPYKLGSV